MVVSSVEVSVHVLNSNPLCSIDLFPFLSPTKTLKPDMSGSILKSDNCGC